MKVQTNSENMMVFLTQNPKKIANHKLLSNIMHTFINLRTYFNQ